jgi:hypothetical protein
LRNLVQSIAHGECREIVRARGRQGALGCATHGGTYSAHNYGFGH